MVGKQGSFALFFDGNSLVKGESSLDVLPVTEIATTQEYKRHSPFQSRNAYLSLR